MVLPRTLVEPRGSLDRCKATSPRYLGDVRGTYARQVPDTMAPPYRGAADVQSSGILIQPWRIAYTTAWVRSFTESLRRIELMWFLTVCSLIDSA